MLELESAVMEGDVEFIKDYIRRDVCDSLAIESAFSTALLQKNIDILRAFYDESSRRLFRFLWIAIEQGHPYAVRELITAGADTKWLNRNTTPLHLATKHGHIGVVRVLLEFGCDIMARNIYNATALHVAAELNRIDIIEELIKRGIDTSARNRNIGTALHIAAEQGHVDAVRILARAEVSFSNNDEGISVQDDVGVMARNRHRATPLHLAAENGHAETIRALLLAGSQVNAVNAIGDTALRFACAKSSVLSVQELIAAGADVEILNNRGRSAMDVTNCTTIKAMLTAEMKWKRRKEFMVFLYSAGFYGQVEQCNTKRHSTLVKVFENLDLCREICQYL